MKKGHLLALAVAVGALVLVAAAGAVVKPSFSLAGASVTDKGKLHCTFTEVNLPVALTDNLTCSATVRWVLLCSGTPITLKISVFASKNLLSTGAGTIDSSIDVNHGAKPGAGSCTVTSSQYEAVKVKDNNSRAQIGIPGTFPF